MRHMHVNEEATDIRNRRPGRRKDKDVWSMWKTVVGQGVLDDGSKIILALGSVKVQNAKTQAFQDVHEGFLKAIMDQGFV